MLRPRTVSCPLLAVDARKLRLGHQDARQTFEHLRSRHALHIDSINFTINVDSTMQSAAALPSKSAREAAEFLGVKPETLYAYASRGLLRRVGTGKRRRYLIEDLERLQTRQRARSGHGPVAAAALSFGEPVLDTRITGIDARGPRATAAARHSSWRWQAPSSKASPSFCGRASCHPWRRFGQPLPSPTGGWGPERTSLEGLWLALPGLAAAAPERPSHTPSLEIALSRQLIRSLAELLLAPRLRRKAKSIAELLAPSTQSSRDSAASALDLALVLLADHELNASSFAARIAASTDASLFACITAALATLTGPRHGGACDRVEALLDEAASLPRPGDVVDRRKRRGDIVPGFGHPLYPQGDSARRLRFWRALARSANAT